MKKLKSIFGNRNFLGVFIALLGAFVLFPPYFELGLFPIPPSEFSWMSIDPSWLIALNYANVENLIWGKDIAFTYGPLSYLSTRVGWGVDQMDFILFDLFISFNFFYLFFKGFINSHSKKLSAILIFSVSFILPTYFGSVTSIILMAFLVFWIRESLENDNYINYIFQILLIVLMFFIKFNTGLISFVLIAAFLVYQWFFNRKLRKLYLVYILTLVTLLVVFSLILNVSLGNYFLSGLNLISGFNEIMYLELGIVNPLFFAIVFIGISTLLLLKNVYVNKKIQFKSVLIIFLFSVSIYVLYKQAFVRADLPHINEFFSLCLLFIIGIREFHVEKLKSSSKSLVLVLIFIAFFVAKGKSDILFNFSGKLQKSQYFEGMSSFTKTSSFRLFPNNNTIPPQITNKIGNKTVDIFPWNINLVFENKLNYLPRPVLQSYSAYTPYLEELNFQHYNSSKAPEYVLYEFESIDNRYPLFDETKVNVVLLNNYTCVDTFHINNKPILLLEKNKDFRPVAFEKIKEYETSVKTAIIPKRDHFYEIEASSSILGSIQSLLSHSPGLFIMINTKDGKGNGFKTSKKLLKSGIYTNQLLTSTLDFQRYMANETLPPNQEVMSYLVWPEDNKYYNDKVKVTEYKIIKK
jgi:hypothetical protein